MERNIETLLLNLLLNEETNVATTEQEVKRYQVSVESHKNRIQRIRAALKALGVEDKNS